MVLHADRRFLLGGQLTAEMFAAAYRLNAGRMNGCLLPGIVLIFATAMNALGIYTRSWEAWPLLLIGIGIPLAYLYARRLAHAKRAGRSDDPVALPDPHESKR